MFNRRPAEELDNHVEAEHRISDDKKCEMLERLIRYFSVV